MKLYKADDGRTYIDGEGKTILFSNDVMPNTVDAAREKHVPVVTINGKMVHVEVGEILHPMIESHFIEWIYVITEKNSYIHYLIPNQQPIIDLDVGDEVVKLVYEYCNIHGLWMKEL